MSPLLQEVRASIFDLAGVIDASRNLLPIFERSEDMARPHIEEASGVLFYVVQERGEELERRTTQDVNELLYWVFDGVTFSMASDYELSNRIEGQDFRILLFERQMDLMGQLSPRWLRRWRSEHAHHLREVGLA